MTTSVCLYYVSVITLPAAAVTKYCNEHVRVYVCVCVSVREHICGTTSAILTTFFVHVAYHHGSVLLMQSDAIPRVRGSFGVFSSLKMHRMGSIVI